MRDVCVLMWVYIHGSCVLMWVYMHGVLRQCSTALTSLSDTGLRRPIVCLKLQVVFRTRATDCRALLQKMIY